MRTILSIALMVLTVGAIRNAHVLRKKVHKLEKGARTEPDAAEEVDRSTGEIKHLIADD